MRRDTALPENPTEDEKRYFEERAHWMKEEVGYTWIQGTKPQTLAYALTDSPVGLAAWIVEKFHTWSDHRGDLDGYLGKRRDADQHHALLGDRRDRLFVLAVLRAHARAVARFPTARASVCRWATRSFRRRSCSPPRSLAEKMYSDIRRWSKMPKGGHFAALEQPELLAQEMREFFRPLR